MNDIQTRVMLEDMQFEYQLRLQLRAVLGHALQLLTDPEANEHDANRVIAMIETALEESQP